MAADWYPARGVVVFTGDWHDVPDMPASAEPTEEACEEWAKQGAWAKRSAERRAKDKETLKRLGIS